MKLAVCEEPLLEFAGNARHVDPRHGIWDYGPIDATSAALRTIRAGIVGTPASVQACAPGWTGVGSPSRPRTAAWAICSCRSPGSTPAPDSAPPSCGIPGWNATSATDIRRLADLKPQDAVRAAVELYAAELELLDEEPGCNVVIIARPETLPETAEHVVDPAAPWKKNPPEEPADDFRALLKAAAMRYGRPIQIIRRTTWDPAFTPPGQDKPRLQDEATRAWNLHTALYYKAGGVPWRLPRNPADLDNCYVGITFYRSTDHETLQTSVAQVFDQLGNGVIVRGAPARVSRHDRQPHLTSGDAKALLTDALRRYRSEHRHRPARVVLHKTSSYTDDEIAGFRAAADDADVDAGNALATRRQPGPAIPLRCAPAAARNPAQGYRPAAHPLHPRQRPVLRHIPRHVHPVPAAVPARRDRIQPRVPRRRAARPDQD